MDINYRVKLLFIHHAAGWGGAPNSMIKIINSLDRRRFSPFVLLLKDSMIREKLIENNIPFKIAQSKFYSKFYSYYSHSVAGYTKWYSFYPLFRITISWILSRFYFARKELKDIQFDIAHLNSSVLTDWLAPCKEKGKVIMHIREPLTKGSFGIRHYYFKKIMQRFADKIIVISKDNESRVGLPEKTLVVYNYIAIPDAKPLFNSYLSKKVLYVGGAAYIKGFHTLVDSLSYLNKDIIVLFAGNYPQFINNISLKERIKHLYVKNRNEISALKKMRKSSNAYEIGLIPDITSILDEVCCLISPFLNEHFSRPVIEAFAYHKPVIVTDIEGIEEVVDNGKDGIIVSKNNPRKLAEAINYICNNSQIAKKMGENGYKKANRLYSPANIQQIIKLYNTLLDH